MHARQCITKYNVVQCTAAVYAGELCLKNENRTSTFRAQALRREVISVHQEKQMCFYTSEYKSDRVTKINQSENKV
jgi:hypothetical protein